MNLYREHPPIDLSCLKSALLKLDATLTEKKAFEVAKLMMGGNKVVSMDEIAEMLGCIEEGSQRTGYRLADAGFRAAAFCLSPLPPPPPRRTP